MGDDFDHVEKRVGVSEEEIRELFSDQPGDADTVIAALKTSVDPPWLATMVAVLHGLERFRLQTPEEVGRWLLDKTEALRTGVMSNGRTPFRDHTERQAAQAIVEEACANEAKAVSKRHSDTIARGVFKGGLWLAAACVPAAWIIWHWWSH